MQFMKRYILFFLLVFTVQFLHAQKQVYGKVKSTSDADLHVIRLQPDSYPQVAVTFHATDVNGNPVWNIDKNDVRVTENGQQAKVVKLRPLSADNGLHTMLVVDHSGSMAHDGRLIKWLNSLPRDSANPQMINHKRPGGWVNHGDNEGGGVRSTYYVKPLPDTLIQIYPFLKQPDCSWYKTPIELAHQATIQFVKMMANDKDKIGIMGFSDKAELRIPDAKPDSETRRKILGMNVFGGTAFYDAVHESLLALLTNKGSRAVVAFTDGMDNRSTNSADDVIKLAKKLNIPVYIVSLGDYDEFHSLNLIAAETGGEYFHTNDPEKLNSIFQSIGRKIKAVYELVYKSPFLTSVTPVHDVQLKFDVDTAFLKTQLFELPLPESVIRELVVRESQPAAALQPEADVLEAQIAAQEAVRFEKEAPPEQQAEFPYGLLIASVSAAGAGSLLVKSRYGKKKPAALQLQQVFPNPASGPVTLSYIAAIASGPVAVHLLNNSGQPVLTESLDFSGTHQLDVSALPAGNYFVQLSAANGTSVLPLIVQH
jgi:Mg-chelatase subunit ChlD